MIGVAGAAGSGKSTLVRSLAGRIPGSVAIHFDSYPVRMPSDLSAWLGAGADFNEWSAPELADEVATARSGDRVVVFEAPLGRGHAATGEHIDFLVFIEVPLEVALARFVRRELAGDSSGLADYLDAYERLARGVYVEQLKQIKPDADLVIDGTLPVEEVVDLVLVALDGDDEWASWGVHP